ncbi:MAG: 16S rRNA (cytidine(1402)-2'-O)-methyltransferase [Clostridia bacterium]|nr:16S rRNA (cytidine(1402)-2'-O)-methyltransferase [Clostridia bacterium]MBR2944549.1 16S rRNA (cytidine(1402)-2'-O)-methyltransferase [Clostridia bacterium]
MRNKEPRNAFHEDKNKIVGGTLYLVATPIGNLSDITERALKTLSEVDFIAAEDTRNTGKLLSYFGISKPMVSYFEHNKRERGEVILERLLGGESCALVTDAGTPAISDPGEDLVVLCAERGVTVTSVPGCSAVVNALALSALPTGRFSFEGFLSTNKNERSERLNEIKNDTRTTIFYEAPHKLLKTLEDILSVFGDRKISLCRELTKLNEEIIRTTISEAIKYYTENAPRGEYVLVIEGASKAIALENAFWRDMSIEEHVEYYISQEMKKMDAIKAVAKDRGVSKSEIYKVVNN